MFLECQIESRAFAFGHGWDQWRPDLACLELIYGSERFNATSAVALAELIDKLIRRSTDTLHADQQADSIILVYLKATYVNA